MKVFYSWQSDLPTSINNYLIKKAIKLAIKRINSEDAKFDEREERVEVDHDTKDVPGTPDIAYSIFNKISEATIFIADISFVGMNVQRKLPNPNVLFELGYAFSKLGSDRVLCVMNQNYGLPEDLPFDLRGRRHPIQYSLQDSATKEEKQKVVEELTNQFCIAIRPILNLVGSEPVSMELPLDPSYDQIVNFILESDSIDDWKVVSRNEVQVTYCKKNPNLRFELDTTFGVACENFKESWANSFPDPNASSYWYRLFYNNTNIDNYILVSVDGGRAELPLPRSINNLRVEPLFYKIAQIHDSTHTLDEYMVKCGLTVDCFDLSHG